MLRDPVGLLPTLDLDTFGHLVAVAGAVVRVVLAGVGVFLCGS